MSVLLPRRFDSNEWFVLITLALGYAIFWFIRKKFPASWTILIMMFCLFAAISFDEILAAPPYNLYDLNDTPNNDLVDVFMWLMYCPFGLLFVYLYERWRLRGLLVVPYLIVWAFISVGFEWVATLMHVFTYNTWKLSYSYPVYIAVASGTLLFYRFVRHYSHK